MKSLRTYCMQTFHISVCLMSAVYLFTKGSSQKNMDHHCVLCIHITIFYRGVIFWYINIINFNNHNLKKFIRAIIPIDLLQIYLLFFTQTRMSETVKKEQVLCHEKKQWLGFITHCLPSTQNILQILLVIFFSLTFFLVLFDTVSKSMSWFADKTHHLIPQHVCTLAELCWNIEVVKSAHLIIMFNMV